MNDYYKMSLEELDRLTVTEYKQEIERLNKEIARLNKLIPTWTKFDRNDPKTFPTKNGNYLVVYFDEIRIVEWYNTYFIAEGSKSYVFSDCVSYWMPSPEEILKSKLNVYKID